MKTAWYFRGLWVALGAYLVLTCATAGGQTPAAQANATVYVYRERHFAGSKLSPSVFCDEVELARIQNGRYFRVRLEPGRHAFHSTAKQTDIDLDARAGEVYYIQAEIVVGALKGHARLTLLSPGQQPSAIHELRALDADMVKDRARVAAAADIPDNPSVQDLEPPRPAAPAPAAVAAPAAAPAPPPAVQAAPPAQPATLAVKSTPDGADISLDGKFVGTTPSTLRVPPGDHALIIQKAGFKPWQRTVTVLPEGMLTIDAALEQQ